MKSRNTNDTVILCHCVTAWYVSIDEIKISQK